MPIQGDPKKALAEFDKLLLTFDRAAAKKSGLTDAQIDEQIRRERMQIVKNERGDIAGGVSSTLGSLPLIGRAQAYAMGVDKKISTKDAMEIINEESAAFREKHPKISLALGIGANVPLMGYGAATPIRTAMGTAAAQRAFSTENAEESLEDKLTGTLMAGAVGGGIAKFLPKAMSRTVPRVALGAAGGAYLAPEDSEGMGALAGGAAAYRPDITAKWIVDAVNKVKLPGRKILGEIAETAGVKGDVNREMTSRQRIESLVDGQVGRKAGIGESLLDDLEARSATAAQEFDDALRQMTGASTHPSFKLLQKNTVIRDAVDKVRASDRFRNLADDDPRLYAEVYKELSEAGFASQRIIEAAAGNRPAGGAASQRFDIGKAKEALLETMDKVAPLHSKAVRNFADASMDIKAYRFGYDTFNGSGESSETQIKKSAEAVQRWLSKLPLKQRLSAAEQVKQGARGALREQISRVPLSEGIAGLDNLSALQPTPFGQSQLGMTGRSAEIGKEMVGLRNLLIDQGAGNINVPGDVQTRQVIATLRRPTLSDRPGVPDIIRRILDDPTEYQKALQRYGRGSEIVKKINMVLATVAPERIF